MLNKTSYGTLPCIGIVLILFLGCGGPDDRRVNDRGLFASLFSDSNRPSAQSVGKRVRSLNERSVLDRNLGRGGENRFDFDGNWNAKRGIVIPSMETFESNRVAMVQNSLPPECTGSYVSTLQPGAFVTYLETHGTDCLDNFLWDYGEYSDGIYSQANMNAVIARLGVLAPLYDGTNGLKILQLLRIFWAGYYLVGSHPLPFDEGQTSQALISPMNLLAGNPHLLDGSDSAGEILSSFFASANNASIAYFVYPTVVSFLNAVVNEPQRMNQYWQTMALNSLMNLIRRNTHPSFPQFLARVDAVLIDKLRLLALCTQFSNDSQVWILDGAIYTLGVISEFRSDLSGQTTQSLTVILASYPYLSEPYLWTVKTLTQNSDCVDLSTGRVCLSQTRNAVRTLAFPNEYALDDGIQIVRTPLSLTTIQGIYHALKQVESQFFRISGLLSPVSADPTTSVSMYIYGSLKDYKKYHTFLYDLPTDNGGIYVEQDRAFYTYQRTPSESIYTLEELFRHEYIHYLVGRFVVPGMWSETAVYDNERMTWFDEGFAEFLTGATSKTVLPRKSLVSQIQNDGSSRMSVSEILSARYGNFQFYRYSGNFFHYLFTYKKDTLNNLISALRDNNIVAFDAIVSQMSQDSALNASFQSYLNGLVADVNNLTNPSTPAPDLTNLNSTDPVAVQSLVRTTSAGYAAKCTTAYFGLNGRFSCRGTTTGSLRSSPDWISSWNDLNNQINGLISTLENGGVNNFRNMNCRIGSIRFNKYSTNQFYPSAIYSCEGPLPARTPVEYSRPGQDQSDFRDTVSGAGTNCYSIPFPTLGYFCNSPLSTGSFPGNTSYEEMYQQLNMSFLNLKSEVFMMRPALYKKIDCGLNSITTVTQSNGNKYLTGTSVCSL